MTASAPEPFKILRKNQRLLAQELTRRGVEVEVLVKEMELIEARYGDHRELLLDRDSSIMPYSSSVLCGQKYLCKRLLRRAGISVPEGEQFFADQIDDARRYTESIRKPLVVKPSLGSHGHGCYTCLEDSVEIEDAIGKVVALVGKGPFLIEEQRPGMEFRVFVTKNGKCAVLHRDPASVTGDGVHTIRQLAESETYRRMNPHVNSLCPILLDDVVAGFLKRAGLALDYVPPAEAKIYLRQNSNVACGGDCEDFTDRAHPSVAAIAAAVLAAFPGLCYAGVDLLSTDISGPQTPANCCVLEVNSNPGLYVHMRPGRGESRNVVSWLADLIFPETAA
jgi:cyanophycin synthetase